jgi:signal transduction histidine kinase
MIERAEAEAALMSTSADARLQAARFFSRSAGPGDLVMINRALSVETVPWIKRALTRAAALASNRRVKIAESDKSESESDALPGDPASALVRNLRAEALEEVAGTILHEFAPIIGALRLRAREEVHDYPSSQTRILLDLLSDLLDAVRHLKRAAAVPRYAEFDLSEIVTATVDSLRDTTEGIEIRFAGQAPFLVSADKESMRLALVNGLRNAVEAVRGMSRSEPPQIAINWGRGGVENWLVIIDSGPGFPGDPATALKLGVTNKEGHIGYGLATAQFAMQSMQGDVLLSNDPAGGAKFELRWDGEHADTVG